MQRVKISAVKENPNNPRFIKDEQFRKLVKSLKDFPEMAEVRPIVVNQDMVVLGGNMRLKAMKEAGWREVPVEIVDWTEGQQREFIIKDNGSFGAWDWDMLANEWDVEQLEEWGLDMPIFAEDEMDESGFGEGEGVEAEFEEGDLIEIGPHRILIGSGLDDFTVKNILQGDKPTQTSGSPAYQNLFLDYSMGDLDKWMGAHAMNIRYYGIARKPGDVESWINKWSKKFPDMEIRKNGRKIA